jgi:hypothetical protein
MPLISNAKYYGTVTNSVLKGKVQIALREGKRRKGN